ncbi:MAG: hypothetical protein EPN89_00150 [Methylovulum sp.]|nr:MAG: hypothetical protein EPN89_00150 [Methylovulum sp.]
MPNNNIAVIRDFHHHYKQLSHTSGYALVYDTMALIKEFIPCREIGFHIIRPASDEPDDVRPGSTPLWVATPLMGKTQQMFYGLYQYIPHIKHLIKTIKRKLIEGHPIEVISFVDDPGYCKSGIIHDFFTKINTSDAASTAGLLNRHQFIESPYTQSYYIAFCTIERENGQTFQSHEKQLFAHFFDIFLEDFKHKISCPENSYFLPYLTGEVFCKKTKLEALFDTGTKFKPRELATIKACFDLKQSNRPVTHATVARYLHLQDRDDCTAAELKRVGYWLDYDLKKIRQHLLRDLEQDTAENYSRLHKEFELEHITDVFKTYAYFGLYPDSSKRFISYLSDKLGN